MRCLTRTIRLAIFAVVAIATGASALSVQAADKEKKDKSKVHPVAIFPFQERGREVSELGNKATDLLFANLAAEPELYLVERADLKKILDEQELNVSGLVDPATATKVGQLTGAKILVTGSVLQVDTSLYVIAKVIGTETSRVLGASVKGGVRDDLSGPVEELAKKVNELVATRAEELVAKSVTREDQLADLKKKLGSGKRPTVAIDVKERHISQVAIDPAAETELALFCSESGFQVLDRQEGKKKADVLITGEGFSEYAARHGNLVSVKARLEVKAVDRATGRLLAIDRHVSIGVDLSEQLAGKNALQDAAAELAGRVLPRLVEQDKGKTGKKK
jgi:TolB-like protein